MIVQWCVKGMSLTDDATAKELIDSGNGIICNWWRKHGVISPNQMRQILTDVNLDRHVNHFGKSDPMTGRPFSESTPFISMSAGTVERDAVAKTNYARRARRTALWFGTEFGRLDHAYLFTCWLLLAPRPAVGIEGVGEEVRDLNSYRRYSAYQSEGEITAKIAVPANQIQCVERWTLDAAQQLFTRTWVHRNPMFTPPEQLSNVRELI
jgi:hypothetical protein